MPLLYGVAALAVAFGYGADKAGEGINDAGTGLAKVAVVGIVGFVVLKKFKVI